MLVHTQKSIRLYFTRDTCTSAFKPPLKHLPIAIHTTDILYITMQKSKW